MQLKIWGYLCCLFLIANNVAAESSFDRELVVKNQARGAKVEQVLKELIRAYENEDAREFLDYVSEDRFRQDYLTFTDALYEDFRTYEIHRVDYWVDRVVADHIKQFLYVRWEKRYETLDDARQLNEKGFSRFVFDEVNGQYLLIELAGNDLFGSSLPEWTSETSTIPGQEGTVSNTQGPQGTPAGPPDLAVVCAYWNNATGGFQTLIRNDGTGSTGQTALMAVSGGASGSSSILRTIPILAPGESYQDAFSHNGLFIASPGYTLDASFLITESDESNNTGRYQGKMGCW